MNPLPGFTCSPIGAQWISHMNGQSTINGNNVWKPFVYRPNTSQWIVYDTQMISIFWGVSTFLHLSA
ncbi:hypothetical protein HYQ46_008113 [Verticillium longisporum]|nr:hypothetical protein HYQ44_016864 [Verticillium longisporum]KAG7139661.1 hypothetical protein HYQ46_008113 [Verticillium longisporum]